MNTFLMAPGQQQALPFGSGLSLFGGQPALASGLPQTMQLYPQNMLSGYYGGRAMPGFGLGSNSAFLGNGLSGLSSYLGNGLNYYMPWMPQQSSFNNPLFGGGTGALFSGFGNPFSGLSGLGGLGGSPFDLGGLGGLGSGLSGLGSSLGGLGSGLGGLSSGYGGLGGFSPAGTDLMSLLMSLFSGNNGLLSSLLGRQTSTQPTNTTVTNNGNTTVQNTTVNGNNQVTTTTTSPQNTVVNTGPNGTTVVNTTINGNNNTVNNYFCQCAQCQATQQPVGVGYAGSVTGDPHFVALKPNADGTHRNYDIHPAPGSVVSLVEDSDIRINAKTGAWQGNPNATVLTDVGLKLGSDRIVFDINNAPTLNGKALATGETKLAAGTLKWDPALNRLSFTSNEYEGSIERAGSGNDKYMNVNLKVGAKGYRADGKDPAGLLGGTAVHDVSNTVDSKTGQGALAPGLTLNDYQTKNGDLFGAPNNDSLARFDTAKYPDAPQERTIENNRDPIQREADNRRIETLQADGTQTIADTQTDDTNRQAA